MNMENVYTQKYPNGNDYVWWNISRLSIQTARKYPRIKELIIYYSLERIVYKMHRPAESYICKADIYGIES